MYVTFYVRQGVPAHLLRTRIRVEIISVLSHSGKLESLYRPLKEMVIIRTFPERKGELIEM